MLNTRWLVLMIFGENWDGPGPGPGPGSNSQNKIFPLNSKLQRLI